MRAGSAGLKGLLRKFQKSWKSLEFQIGEKKLTDANGAGLDTFVDGTMIDGHELYWTLSRKAGTEDQDTLSNVGRIVF